MGRQPIIDGDSSLCAYEILYRDAQKQSDASSDRYATASVISSVLNKFGTRNLLGNRKAFVKIDEKFLLGDIIFSIPKEFFIFALLDVKEISQKIHERIELLHKEGYFLALNDVTLTNENMQKYQSIFAFFSYVKIHIDTNSNVDIKEMIQKLKSHNIIIIATKIETSQEYANARDLGAQWFQGYFFAKPKIVETRKYEPSQMNVLHLYNLLMEDVNIDEITKEFENNHEITLQLLQFINSGAFHFRNKIASIHHILTLMGRMPLAKWLMLMIYSKSVSKDDVRSPLMLLVKNRTELMESILKTVQPNVKSNMLGEAYFVGVLSLIDTIFGETLEKILEDMNISQDVKDALLKDEGLLGEIYALVREIEEFNTQAIKMFEKRHNLEDNALKNLILESMESVNKFENPKFYED